MKYQLALVFVLAALTGCQHYGSVAAPFTEESMRLGDHAQWAAARDRALEATRRDPGYAPAWDALARAYSNLNAFDDELHAAQEAVCLMPGNSRYQFGLAYALGDLGKWEESLAPAKRTLELDPSYAQGFRNFAYTLNILNRQTEALGYARRATELNPQDAGTWQLYGAILSDLARYEEAIVALRRALELSPEDPQILRTLGSAYVSIDQPGVGIPFQERAVKLSPADVTMQYELMYAYEAANQAAKAAAMREQIIKIARDAVAAAPGDAQAQIGLGHAYSAVRQFADARDAYAKALPLAKTPRDTADAYIGIGATSLDLVDGTAAIAAFTRLVELQPENAGHHRQLAQGYFFNHDFAKSAAEYDRALHLLDRDAHTAAYLMLWQILAYRNINEPAKANEVIEAGIARQKEWPGPVFLYLEGKLTADELLTRAGSSRDKLTEAHAYIGYALRGSDPAGAHAHFQWVVEHGTPTYIEYRLGRSELKN